MTEASPSPEPFWLHQPWRILTDILDLQRISPWEIDLAELVNGFMGRLLATGQIDFRICGRALLSAAILLRIKTEYLLEFGREEEEDVEEVEEEFFLPPIRPPFRQQLRPPSEAELLFALRELLYPRVTRRRRRRYQAPIPGDIIGEVGEARVELTRSLERLLKELRRASRHRNPLSFADFVQGMSRTEIIRIFLCLLYLVAEGSISITQEYPFGDITITVINGEGDGGNDDGG